MKRSGGYVAIVLLLISVLAIGFVVFSYYSNPTSSPLDRADNASDRVDKINETIENRADGIAAVDNPAQIIEYSDASYQDSLESGKLVVLYFYANWCPICRAEFPKMESAFTRLDGDGVIGIRVNYNDAETTDEEERLAEGLNIPYQHTKVFIRDGEEVFRDLESWSEEKYLEEIMKHL